MRSEMDRFESVLTTQTTLAHRPLFSGTVGGRPVSVLNTGMGLTNTAIALLAALDALESHRGASNADAPTPEPVAPAPKSTRSTLGKKRSV
jgi:hypothetical protein